MQLAKSKCLVIKIGSSTLISDEGKVREQWLAALAEDIAALRKRGTNVIVVSSGAVALGRKVIGFTSKNIRLEEKQAAAACGQIRLMEAWQRALGVYDLQVGQILLTADDTENRRRYLNARTTMNTLLEHGIIPIVNENDTVTTREMRYGDNDRLAASVAAMVGADLLILLSTIDGLYDANPSTHPEANHIPLVTEITAEISAMAGEAAGVYSSGGMRTKVMAAAHANAAGCHLVITDGRPDHPLRLLEQGARASWFIASATPLSARKQWIAGSVKPAAALIVDEGAKKALRSGGSLLPAGVVALDGEFERGDTVLIKDKEGGLLGRGLATYRSEDARQIIGKRSDQIMEILGFHRRNELIHRDDMVLE